MRRRAFVFVGLLSTGALAVVLTGPVTHGQGPAAPKTLPPDLLPPTAIEPTKGVVPAAAAAPAKKPAPFDRFRKYDELPELTRQLVFATQMGAEWLSRDLIHQPNGRFLPGVNPALGKATDDDHFIRQALGAFALARAARLMGDEKYATKAGHTILSLLAEVPKDPANPAARKPVMPSALGNKVGAAAYLALAIYELPDGDAALRQCGEELCQFLRGHLEADGSVRFMEPAETAQPDGAQFFPGAALAALAMSHRATPAEWKKDALTRGAAFYRAHFRAHPHPAMVPWLVAAFAEMHLMTRDAAFADAVFEMTDWLKQLQFDSPDGHRAAWRGGFPTIKDGKVAPVAPTIDTANYAMGLADACRMIRQMDRPDSTRYDAYRVCLVRALQFVTTLQYGDENTQHLAAHFRPAVVGAFHPSATDGTVRVDQTAVAVAALCQFLIAGVDR